MKKCIVPFPVSIYSKASMRSQLRVASAHPKWQYLEKVRTNIKNIRDSERMSKTRFEPSSSSLWNDI